MSLRRRHRPDVEAFLPSRARRYEPFIVAACLILGTAVLVVSGFLLLRAMMLPAFHERTLTHLRSHWAIDYPQGSLEVVDSHSEVNREPTDFLTTLAPTGTAHLDGGFFDPATMDPAPLTPQERDLIEKVHASVRAKDDAITSRPDLKKRSLTQSSTRWVTQETLLCVFDPVTGTFHVYERLFT